MELIDLYIENSRIIKPYKKIQPPKDVMLDYYRKLYQSVCIDKHKYPEFRLCYSVSKLCEMVCIEGKSYLVYDQYLGQSLAQWNTLFLSSATTQEDIVRYMYKCMAEILYVNGYYDFAIIPGLYYDELMKDANFERLLNPHKGFKQFKHILEKSWNNMVHEQFIMLHEICHWLLKNDPEYKERIENKRREVIENDAYIIFAKDGIIEKIQDADSKRVASEMLEDRLKWYEQDSNIEELICDEYAFTHLLRIFSSIDKREIASSCMLCMNNLRMLDGIKFTAFKDFVSASKRDSIEQKRVNKSIDTIHFEIMDAQYRKHVFVYITAPIVLYGKMLCQESYDLMMYLHYNADDNHSEKIGSVVFINHSTRKEVNRRVRKRLMNLDAARFLVGIKYW